MGLFKVKIGDIEDIKAAVARKQVFSEGGGVVVLGHQQHVCSIEFIFCFDLTVWNEATIRAMNHAEASETWFKNGRSFVFQ